MTTSELISYLEKEFHSIKKRNPSYSKRSFARKLGIQASALSEVLSGKRGVSDKRLKEILQRLCTPPDTRRALIQAHSAKFKEQKEKKFSYKKLDMVSFAVISDWRHFAILSLLNTKYFRYDADWISAKLNTSKNSIVKAIDRLLALGFVKKTRSGKLKRSQAHYTTSDGLANDALRKSHHETLDLAAHALDEMSVDERDFVWITVAANSQRIPEAKALIRELRDQIAEILEDGHADRIYRFHTGLFPLSDNLIEGEQGND